MAVAIPRDRKGKFEPQLLKKNRAGISQDIEEKILSMYAKGMTTSDIESHIRDIYDIDILGQDRTEKTGWETSAEYDKISAWINK